MTQQHVYARLSGYGLIVVPRAPFEIRQSAELSGMLSIEHRAGDGEPLVVQLIPSGGGYESKLSGNTQSLIDVADVEAGPQSSAWKIETTVFTCCWPEDYALCSNLPSDPAAFYLIGSQGELIYVQHPRHVPDVAEMCAENQTAAEIERSSAWDAIDVDYSHAGQQWRQRHIVVDLHGRRIAVTMQAPAEFAAEATAGANQIAASLALFESK